MRIAIYARTSTNTQTTGLESQLHALKTYCASKGISEYIVYTDAGVSGAKSSRPGLDQLMADVNSGAISQVITYSLSRLSRSTKHLLQVIESLKNRNVGFISLSEAIDLNSPMGLMVLTVLGAVAWPISSEIHRPISSRCTSQFHASAPPDFIVMHHLY